MLTFLKDWGIMMVLTLVLALYLLFALNSKGQEERVFMPGPVTHGHHQIEMQCSVCHTEDMAVKQDSCLQCHAEELKRVNDSHPVIKFKDPRNAKRLEHVDARYCISCHKEHQPHETNAMGVTLPNDYCYHCHENVGENRPTHKGLDHQSCATAGCHNFHDNSALYESFIARHMDAPDFSEEAIMRARDFYKVHYKEVHGALLTEAEANHPASVKTSKEILHDWSSTAHAAAGVNCTSCHNMKNPETGKIAWVDKPDHTSCATCHKNETTGFLEGKHGMRLAQGLTPMTPAMAKIPMHADAAHKELSCVSCHNDHTFDTRYAAVNACASCHNDQHTQNYFNSQHYRLWEAELSGAGEKNSGVSCATCHMPRVTRTEFGEDFTMVDHNQNNYLRPNEKMIRSSCIECHGLPFILNALADEELIKQNFVGRPSVTVDSVEMTRAAKEADEARRKTE